MWSRSFQRAWISRNTPYSICIAGSWHPLKECRMCAPGCCMPRAEQRAGLNRQRLRPFQRQAMRQLPPHKRRSPPRAARFCRLFHGHSSVAG